MLSIPLSTARRAGFPAGSRGGLPRDGGLSLADALSLCELLAMQRAPQGLKTLSDRQRKLVNLHLAGGDDAPWQM